METWPDQIKRQAAYTAAFGVPVCIAASRVIRERRFKYTAWTLIPDDGPWFWVSTHWTRWGANRAVAAFAAVVR